MQKIRIQRINRSKTYNPHFVDSRLKEGFLEGRLQPGKEMDIQFARLDEGRWHTTKITKIVYAGEKTSLVHTKNSTYLVMKDWEGE